MHSITNKINKKIKTNLIFFLRNRTNQGEQRRTSDVNCDDMLLKPQLIDTSIAQRCANVPNCAIAVAIIVS